MQHPINSSFLPGKPSTKTTDTQELLDKVKHIVSNDLDNLLAKTARAAPLENDEVKRLKILSEILNATVAEEREQRKSETPVDPTVHNTLMLQGVALEDLVKQLKPARKED